VRGASTPTRAPRTPLPPWLRLAPLAGLLAGCAAAPASERLVLLETDAYACGAAEGLGCGLALAPALTALDEVEGVAESRVSWDGRYFRIDLLPGADAERVAAAAGNALEGSERRLPASDLPGGAGAGWWNAAGTVELSRYEARVLAERLTAGIAQEQELPAETRQQLSTFLHAELKQAFEQAHAAGGGIERLREQVPQRRADLASRLDFLTAAQRAEVLGYLDRELAE
jgi:hypothetical protein